MKKNSKNNNTEHSDNNNDSIYTDSDDTASIEFTIITYNY